MANRNNKSNANHLMLFLCSLISVAIVLVFLFMMVVPGNTKFSYNDPEVASKVYGGTVYDRNGRALSIQIPRYTLCVSTDYLNSNELNVISNAISNITGMAHGVVLTLISNATDTVEITTEISQSQFNGILELIEEDKLKDSLILRKTYERTYPNGYHASQVIHETEKVFYDYLNPVPGFNEEVTYGKDVYLTIDIDMQYVLDDALQLLYNRQNAECTVGFITDYSTGEIMAISSCPYPASPQEETNGANIAYVNHFLDKSPYFVKTPENSGRTGFTVNADVTEYLLLNAGKINNSGIFYLPDEKQPKYVLFLGSFKPQRENSSRKELENAAELVRQNTVTKVL